MVVDDVEDHREPVAVGGGDKLGEPGRTAVGGLRGGEIDAVVAPAAGPRELGDRHHLDRGDPPLGELLEVLGGGRERPLLGERADMQLVDDQLIERRDPEAVADARQRARVEQP